MSNVIIAVRKLDKSISNLEEYKDKYNTLAVEQFEKQFKGMYKDIVFIDSFVEGDSLCTYIVMTEPTNELKELI